MAMHWPAWLLVNTTAKWWLFWSSRAITWTGFFWMRRRLQARRLWWAWVLVINTLSLSALGLLLFWWTHRAYAR